MDVAILSKIERGQRPLSREMIIKFAEIYEANPEDLQVLYLSQKILYEYGDDDLGVKAMRAAESQTAYLKSPIASREEIIQLVHNYFKKDPRIAEAWLFGSYARREMTSVSDIDVMVRFHNDHKISMFDLGDIQHQLSKVTGRIIDLVEHDTLLPFAVRTAEKDMIKIYG